ncbi:MAG: hypothetical protein K9N55_11890 [Phycisphaerae bacterium]|nr:hypothetical protein [Phycisphaerae bacterium]
MTISPDVVLSLVGAVLLLIAFTGGVKWGGMSIAEATGLKARIASGMCGAACLSISMYLYMSPLTLTAANATPQTRGAIDTVIVPQTPAPTPPIEKELPIPAPTPLVEEELPIPAPTPLVEEEPPVPEPAPPIETQPSSPDGIWHITMESRYEIIWEMTISTQGNDFKAEGPKLFVNGEPATFGERNTILTFTGTMEDLEVSGHYTETQSGREVNGRIEITFSKDNESLRGIIHHPGGQAGSKFTGYRVPSLLSEG